MNYLVDLTLVWIVVGICTYVFNKFNIPGKEKFSSSALWVATIIMAGMGIFFLANNSSYGMTEDPSLHVVSILIGITFLLIASLGPIKILRHKKILKQEGRLDPPMKITAFGLIVSAIAAIVVIFIVVEVILAYNLPR